VSSVAKIFFGSGLSGLRKRVEKSVNMDYNYNTMKMTISEITSINDKIFKKIFGDVENTKDFLKKVLPREIKQRLDFSSIKIDPTNYVSNEFQEGYSDIVVEAKMKSRSSGKIPTEIYFILEHKTEGRVKVFFQILKYMCFVWEKDIDANKPMRVIIPIIFYHGKEKWNVPDSFAGQFDVDEEVKRFLLDFRYISHTQKISRKQLKKMLDESKIDGGDIMQTLAQQLKKEGEKKGKKEGKKEEKQETAKRMLLNNFSVEQVITITGLTEKEVKALMN
jgi:predicted transposase YdaD